MYSAMSDQELDAVIAEIHQSHPNTGYRMMKSFLHARGLLVQRGRSQPKAKLFTSHRSWIQFSLTIKLQLIKHHIKDICIRAVSKLKCSKLLITSNN
ncbi:hypothetical protein CRENBAI_010406 [Crenichthys baileyi]|uniref:Transposase n=1 Tax=Crenichthys baileyi TaxID=28760 RepID=A0AAV9QVY3_9TELE